MAGRASHCGYPGCTLRAGHGGDFHVGSEVEPGTDRRWLYPKANATAIVRARLGPGPYVGKLSETGESADDVFLRRAGIDPDELRAEP